MEPLHSTHELFVTDCMMVHTTSEVKGFLPSQTCPSLIKGVISTPQDQK